MTANNNFLGSALDQRLEQVMESHRTEAPKVATATPEQASGLQSFVERPTIREEIAAIHGKVASVDLNVELAKDHMDTIIEGKASRMDAFLDAVKTAADEVTRVDPVKTAQELIRQGVDPQEAARRALA